MGKSTQLKLLRDYLERTGQDAVYVREPGSTDISEQIRSIILDPKNRDMTPETEALLYAAARAQLVSSVIRPALDAGRTVICDRYIDSSVAYQGYARGLGREAVERVNASSTSDPRRRSGASAATTGWRWRHSPSTTKFTKVISRRRRRPTGGSCS